MVAMEKMEKMRLFLVKKAVTAVAEVMGQMVKTAKMAKMVILQQKEKMVGEQPVEVWEVMEVTDTEEQLLEMEALVEEAKMDPT